MPKRQQSYGLQRLTAGDLPATRLKVLTSTIRPNERGKEVLSFIVVVAPSAEKEPWKIEKLYSNVLALDTRVRALLGRNQLKKIAPLPDNKLFKDNAPAKVDQRKAILEAYLQSLLHPPSPSSKGVGGNSGVYAEEICEFFSSDIVSEGKRAPVAQMGYKEGYLTKRGKNFGGWKTRYFVLQGPVLEYYESVRFFPPFISDVSDDGI
jgi:RalA-binding protein 1